MVQEVSGRASANAAEPALVADATGAAGVSALPGDGQARSLEQLDGARLYQFDARDIQGGAIGRQYLPVRVRADTRADAIARLIASDFEPLLDWEDLGLEPLFCANSYPDMRAAIAREIPAA